MQRRVDVGRRIKRYRQKYNLTLKDIESRVEVSATHVSEIERGKTSPTIGALARIADALQVDPAVFLITDDLPRARVTRADARSRVRFESDGYVAHPLSAPVPGQDLSVALVHFEPTEGEPHVHQHPGEEFGLILDGEIELVVGDETFTVASGDSVHFRSDLPHGVVNRGSSVCVAIWSGSPKFGV